MKKLTLFLMILAAGFGFQACNNASTTNTDTVEAANDSNENNSNMAVKDDDSEFMVDAANGGMMEVEMGKLAQTKAQSQAVKDFAARMVADHSKANDELKALAATKNVTLPSAIDQDGQDHLADMGKKSGADFDKDYVDMMVKDHDKDVSMFEDEEKDAKDPDVKAWVSKTLPTLREHQQAIKAINDKQK
jgi:putative membrane protein